MWKVFYGTYAFFGKMLKLSSVALGGGMRVGGSGTFVLYRAVLAPGDATHQHWWTTNNAHAHDTK